MAGKKHLHKYYFGLMIGNQPVWACALDGCTHYMPNHMKEMLNHKAALCWKCEERAIIDFGMMNEYPQGKVLCEACITLNRVNRIREGYPPEPTTDSHIEGRAICTRCKQHPAAEGDANGHCSRCANKINTTPTVKICSRCKILPVMAKSDLCHGCFLGI